MIYNKNDMEEETKEILEGHKEETKRHFDVVAEDLSHKIEIVGEGVVGNSQSLETVKSGVKKNSDTLEVVKLDLEFIKNELKQKISRDEFAFLEKRVSLLEGRVS